MTILIVHTTLYREGGAQFAKAAATLAREKRRVHPRADVLCRAVESKAAFLQAFAEIAARAALVDELHFIGHSGVYGIMFGSRQWPEQFSPFEWRQISLPFAPGAQAYFHACRSGRWFAPFFARTFQVRAHGFEWYTTVSRLPDAYRRETGHERDLYVISSVGRKSHGLAGAAAKRLGFGKVFPLTAFDPILDAVDATYDDVAALYDATFDDIAVRSDEIRWFERQLGDARSLRLLDIGCGNGAFLSRLAPSIAEGVGIDASGRMIARARSRSAGTANLSFEHIASPELPFADNSFDRVTSMLSFRYLDWDPIVREILRVLKPGGEFLVLDMVAAPVTVFELPAFARGKLGALRQRIVHRSYFAALRRMVGDSRWKAMLTHNPMRSEHEMRWYLESRFAPRKAEIVNLGWSARILAFRSGPVRVKSVDALSYP